MDAITWADDGPRAYFVVFEGMNLAIGLWEGVFKRTQARWLPFFDGQGVLLLTGEERAAVAERRAETAEQRADTLAAKLRQMGLDPDSL